MKDLQHNIVPVQSLAPAATAATRNGTGVDLQDYESAVVEIDVGVWTDGSHTPSLQESPDNATWTNVAAGDMIGSFTAITSAGQANAVQSVGYKGNLRYIRPVITVATATTGAVIGANVWKGNPRFHPAGSTTAP